ncbi:hypothetical protein K445DRAFT_154587 [Daldinia sp. EC12]|nr:hypothetical protein K445DRAFT_154587 [Daldinia sp. EC12]
MLACVLHSLTPTIRRRLAYKRPHYATAATTLLDHSLSSSTSQHHQPTTQAAVVTTPNPALLVALPFLPLPSPSVIPSRTTTGKRETRGRAARARNGGRCRWRYPDTTPSLRALSSSTCRSIYPTVLCARLTRDIPRVARGCAYTTAEGRGVESSRAIIRVRTVKITRIDGCRKRFLSGKYT